MTSEAMPTPTPAFSEKGFYLSEFRGRTLALAVSAEELSSPASLEAVLKELEANSTRVVLVSSGRGALESLAIARPLGGDLDGLEGAVWRGLGRSPRVGVVVEAGSLFAPACRKIGLRLGVSKLVWIDRGGGLRAPDGSRQSFMDLEELRAFLARGDDSEGRKRRAMLREIEAAISAGLPAVNLCTIDGLADELFTYAGSGTLITRESYVRVRRLGLDDYDAADGLIARGVAEGYLAPRTAEQVEGVLANGFGAFVEGRHLAGIGALLVHEAARAGEIVSLYTLTRFLGEGIGGHLVRFALERADRSGCRFVFACTTAEPVVRFFERHGFRRVGVDAIPRSKWRAYDPARRARLIILRRDVGDGRPV